MNNLMEPLTSIIGLPAIVAIVLTTTMITNLYTGLIIFSSLSIESNFSIGQATILATFMLLAHALPVEILISNKTGVRVIPLLLLRIGGAVIICIFLNKIFTFTGWLSEPAVIKLPELAVSNSLIDWILSQIKGIIFIQIIIIILLFFLEFLKFIGIEKLIRLLMNPFLKILGIGEKASSIAVVGITLGLTFGGGLLIKETSKGEISKKDVFGIICFINLLHSVFEDTSLMLLLGANLFIILFGRAIFAMLLTFFLMKICLKLPGSIWNKFLTNKNIK
ncbi:nucleoside recognition domain-containing protein [Alphaproteobacteria bacterium]|nr:nucleoside recognition domain-containing protein [Alphaproteobacteria bacterium]